MKLLFPLLLTLGVAHSYGAEAADKYGPALSDAAAGTSLKHFGKVDDGVYKGSRPKNDADYRFLQSLHVKYIVDLQALPLLTWSEKRKAKKFGITVIPGVMNASPVTPSAKHINKILAILRDDEHHPVYFHCKFGRDRTAVIAALYKMYFQGMTEPEGMQYLHDTGYAFRFGWLRSGLTRYLKEHPTAPPELRSLRTEVDRGPAASKSR